MEAWNLGKERKTPEMVNKQVNIKDDVFFLPVIY